MQLEATDLRRGKAFRGKAHRELYPSDLEEHTNLEVLGGYYFENGATITGGNVIYINLWGQINVSGFLQYFALCLCITI